MSIINYQQGFPYPQSGNEVARCKKKVKDIFWNNKYEKAIYPLSWLIEKFWPVKGWDEKSLSELSRIFKYTGKFR